MRVNGELVYTLPQVAQLLGKTLKSVRSLADKKHLPCTLVDGRRVVTEAALRERYASVWHSVLLCQRMAAAARVKQG